MDKANKRVKTDKRDGRFNEGTGIVLGFSGGFVPLHETGCCYSAPQAAWTPKLQASAWGSSSASLSLFETAGKEVDRDACAAACEKSKVDDLACSPTSSCMSV